VEEVHALKWKLYAPTQDIALGVSGKIGIILK
jgi:hypothetical protein